MSISIPICSSVSLVPMLEAWAIQAPPYLRGEVNMQHLLMEDAGCLGILFFDTNAIQTQFFRVRDLARPTDILAQKIHNVLNLVSGRQRHSDQFRGVRS